MVSKADDGELEVDSPFMEAGMDSFNLSIFKFGFGTLVAILQDLIAQVCPVLRSRAPWRRM